MPSAPEKAVVTNKAKQNRMLDNNGHKEVVPNEILRLESLGGVQTLSTPTKHSILEQSALCNTILNIAHSSQGDNA